MLSPHSYFTYRRTFETACRQKQAEVLPPLVPLFLFSFLAIDLVWCQGNDHGCSPRKHILHLLTLFKTALQPGLVKQNQRNCNNQVTLSSKSTLDIPPTSFLKDFSYSLCTKGVKRISCTTARGRFIKITSALGLPGRQPHAAPQKHERLRVE